MGPEQTLTLLQGHKERYKVLKRLNGMRILTVTSCPRTVQLRLHDIKFKKKKGQVTWYSVSSSYLSHVTTFLHNHIYCECLYSYPSAM